MSYSHSDYGRVAQSMLKDFVRSSEDYYHLYVAQDIPVQDIGKRGDVLIGTILHQALLEKIPLTKLICAYPQTCFRSNGTLNPVPAQKYRDLVSPLNVLSDHDHNRVIEIYDAVLDHELGSLIKRQDITFEEPIYWVDSETGIECRGKPDFIYEDDDCVYCYDLKFTSQIYPREWERVAKRCMYWLQDAHYTSGMEAIYGKPVKFRFWCVETKRPYRIAPREYDPTSKGIARDAYRDIMRSLKACMDSGDWRDDWTKQVDFVSMSPWDIDSKEEELEGFDES